MLAALTDPVPSKILMEHGLPVTVPLGKALLLNAVEDWSGEFDLRGEGRLALAEDHAGGVVHGR